MYSTVKINKIAYVWCHHSFRNMEYFTFSNATDTTVIDCIQDKNIVKLL